MVLSILLFGLFVQGLLAMFVYRDAYQRGAEQGLWAVATLLFGIIGVLVYLIQRPDEKLSEEQLEQSASAGGLKVIVMYIGMFFVGVVLSLVGTDWYMQTFEYTQTSAIEILDILFFGLLVLPAVVLFVYRHSSYRVPSSM